MTAEERVKEIAVYLGESELICRKCGSILHVNEVEIEMKAGKRGNPIFWAICPDCEARIKRMKNSKKERIFWKGQMLEIDDFDTSLLLWMLQVGFLKSDRVIDAVRAHLKGRIVTNKTIEPMSLSEQREITLKKEIRALNVQLADKTQAKALINHAVIMNAATWDAIKMGQEINKINGINKRIKEIEKDIKAKQKELEQ